MPLYSMEINGYQLSAKAITSIFKIFRQRISWGLVAQVKEEEAEAPGEEAIQISAFLNQAESPKHMLLDLTIMINLVKR